MTVIFDLTWRDYRLALDEASIKTIPQEVYNSLTVVDGLYIAPQGDVWQPDIRLFNAVNNGDMSDPGSVQWIPSSNEANALIWWARLGQIQFSCQFVMTDFPFDSQRCTAKFSR